MLANDNKVAIYSRKSKFTGKGESIENQIELCKQFIGRKFPDISADNILIFEDEGFSGGNTKRPQFQNMIKQAKGHRFRAVVCYRLDRISRNVCDFQEVYQELDDYGVDFFSINENFDTSTPQGRAMMTIAATFAQLERETIAERIRDNMYELAKTGRWLGGTTPTGYSSEEVKKVTIEGKVRTMHKLSIVDNEAEIVKMVFLKFLEYNSLTKTETYLLNNGFKTKRGNCFDRVALKAILTNPVYMIADNTAYKYFINNGVELFSQESEFDGANAIMAYNKTLQKPNKAKKRREMDEWVVAVGKHKGIISSDDWIKTHEYLNQNKSKAYRKPKSNDALLSGILICGKCGSYMRPKKTQRQNQQGEFIFDYLCELKERSHNKQCKINRPNGNKLDPLVAEQIKMLTEDNGTFIRQLNAAQKALKSQTLDFDSEIERLGKSKAENEKSIIGLSQTLMLVGETPAKQIAIDRINQLSEQNKEIEKQIAGLKAMSKAGALSEMEFDLLREAADSFSKSFDELDVPAKRELLRSCINKIIWDGETARIIPFGVSQEKIKLTEEKQIAGNPLCKDSK